MHTLTGLCDLLPVCLWAPVDTWRPTTAPWSFLRGVLGCSQPCDAHPDLSGGPESTRLLRRGDLWLSTHFRCGVWLCSRTPGGQTLAAPRLLQFAGSDRVGGRCCSEDVPSELHGGQESVGGTRRGVRLCPGWGQWLPCWASCQVLWTAPPSVLPAGPRGRVFMRARLVHREPMAQRSQNPGSGGLCSEERALGAHARASLRALRPAACSSGQGCGEGRGPAQWGPWL